MNLTKRWKEYFGKKDERVYAEVNRIYKTGFLMLTFGTLVGLFYSINLAQVRSVATGESATPDGLTLFMFALVFVTCVVCTTMQVRKGIVDEHVRFADTETFPSGYFGLIAVLTGVGVELACGLCRCVAEMQVIGLAHVHWAVNFLMNLGTCVFTALLVYAVFYCMFRAAKNRQKDMMGD